MTITALDATNLSVKNAAEFVQSVKDNTRILSFFLGGDSTETETNLNTDERRNAVFKDSSTISRVDPAGVNVVVPNVEWVNGRVYGKWNAKGTPDNTYYLTYNNNVYLILGNSDLNTARDSKKIPVSTPPTHTSGAQTYDDGYTYLYLYTLSITDKGNVNSTKWISVPDKVLSSFAGKITTLEIDLDTITSSNLIIGEKDPVIPILSDSGSGASIKLETVVVSSPYTTTSQREYKIVGVKYINHGTSAYIDSNLTDSLTAVLTDESASQVADISNSIKLGFSSKQGLNIREVLGAKYAIVNCEVDSNSLTSVTEQREFFNFGIIEGVEKEDGTPVFTGDEKGTVTNQLKASFAILSGASAGSPDADEFTIGTAVTLNASGSELRSETKVVSSKQKTSSLVELELHVFDINSLETGDKLTFAKNDNTYTVTSVTKPDVKQDTGQPLHIGSTRFSFDEDTLVNKRFFAQVIQRF